MQDQNISEQNQEFIKNSVGLVLTKLCPDYPVKERSAYFQFGNFFIMIDLQHTKNHLIVGMTSEHNMRKDLMELTFVFNEHGGFEITEYPENSINNLVFKLFIELRNELEKKRLIRARAGKWGRTMINFKERFKLNDKIDY